MPDCSDGCTCCCRCPSDRAEKCLVVAWRCATLGGVRRCGGVVPPLASEQGDEREGSAQLVLKSNSSPRPPLSQALNLTASWCKVVWFWAAFSVCDECPGRTVPICCANRMPAAQNRRASRGCRLGFYFESQLKCGVTREFMTS